MILLNGGSSSGKTGIVRCLQAIVPEPWLATGVDTLIASMPIRMQGSNSGVERIGGAGWPCHKRK
ncbi:MAG TPA: hypothetical protein VFU65_06970 [Actinocrinis sp.]|nr:hypothetical protein [Actinocrinis sp.]